MDPSERPQAGPSEHQIQTSVILWAKWKANSDPRYESVIGYPAQGGANMGKWGALRVAEGLAKGFPDLWIIIPNHDYHGLFIELKAKKGQIRDEQIVWKKRLECLDYAHSFCFSVDDATHLIDSYICGRAEGFEHLLDSLKIPLPHKPELPYRVTQHHKIHRRYTDGKIRSSTKRLRQAENNGI